MDEEDYEDLPSNNIYVHMAAGSLAGVSEHCVMYPLDSVKTMQQSLCGQHDGITRTMRDMIRNEGFLRPFRGMGAVIYGAGPAHAAYFSCYEFLKKNMSNSANINDNYYVHGASGAIATVLHDSIMTPSDVVKQRMQVAGSPYSSLFDCVRTVFRTEGVSAFYRSFVTQLVMNVPFQSLHFVVYEYMQNQTNSKRTYNPSAHMISGAIAGGIAAAVTNPLDVCKTLLNTQESAVLSNCKKSNISGLRTAFLTVYQVRGAWGYMQGVHARVMFQMPATAICWSVYEFFKHNILKTPVEKVAPPQVAPPLNIL